MRIEIRYCNSIDAGVIAIDEHKLNIKYAMNGVGKSTVARAIELHTRGDGSISALTPFKYRGMGDTACVPSVTGLDDIGSIAVFNDSYINQFAFQQDEVLINSFEIFVRTPDYDAHIDAIDRIIGEIKTAFRESEEIDRVIGDLTALSESFGKAKSGYSEAGALAKGIGRGNKVANIPKGLESYGAYLKSTLNSKWIKWQTDGNVYTGISDDCPFCTSPTKDKKELIAKVGQEYDAKSIEHLNKIMAVLESLGAYFSDEARTNLENITKTVIPLSKEIIGYLLRIKEQIEILRGKMLDLRGLSFFSMKDVAEVEDYFTRVKIDLTYLPDLDSASTRALVEHINDLLDSVLAKVGILQGEVAQQNRLIQKTIEDNKTGINDFLRFAGYKYHVDVEYAGSSYKMRLRHADYAEAVENGGQHLSYGEKNAFALVLFMYQCLAQAPDMIVLDDPISSFDRNKKYAVLDMLFRRKKSLKGKTVLMMTHDLEPVIDILYNLPHHFEPLPSAAFLQPRSGSIIETPITRADISTFGRICDENLQRDVDDVVRVVYLRRYYEVLDNKGLAYELLSNLLKKRTAPFRREDGVEILLTEPEIAEASEEIRKKLASFDYDVLLGHVSDQEHVKRAYRVAQSNYEKLQLFRVLQDGQTANDVIKKFIDETFHIENEYVMQINPCKYDVVPAHIVEECDRVVLCSD